ncbi:hypothetical protein DBR06_SOUSAS17610020, partial [Sousa chinensis]
MITDNFQKWSDSYDQQQVAPLWQSGIAGASEERKKCMRIFCKKTQEQ